jgi:predicted anti-sigma-YlaC factor YlaD
MLNPIPPLECAQARESASAQLDGELTELDGVRLEAHLRDCAECRAYAEGLAALAARLRDAPLARPEVTVFLPRRRRMPTTAAAAAAALVAAAVGSSFVLGRVLGTSGSAPAVAGARVDVASVQADSTQQHLLAMLGRLEPVPTRPGRLQAV